MQESSGMVWPPTQQAKPIPGDPAPDSFGKIFSSLFLSVSIREKSALGWLANKGEWWMPRLEKAMKDAA
jgi:hypothetical protein